MILMYRLAILSIPSGAAIKLMNITFSSFTPFSMRHSIALIALPMMMMMKDDEEEIINDEMEWIIERYIYLLEKLYLQLLALDLIVRRGVLRYLWGVWRRTTTLYIYMEDKQMNNVEYVYMMNE